METLQQLTEKNTSYEKTGFIIISVMLFLLIIGIIFS